MAEVRKAQVRRAHLSAPRVQRETSVPYGALPSRDVRLLSPVLKATSNAQSHRNECRNQPHPRDKEKKRKRDQVQVQ